TQRCASASENGPDCSPSIETYHSSSSAGGGLAICAENAAPSAPLEAELAKCAGAAVVGRERLRPGPESAASASDIPSRTVMTLAQFLQRILRILPRTRSSPIE